MSLELVNKTVSVSLTTRLDCVKLHVRVAVVFGAIFFSNSSGCCCRQAQHLNFRGVCLGLSETVWNQ